VRSEKSKKKEKYDLPQDFLKNLISESDLEFHSNSVNYLKSFDKLDGKVDSIELIINSFIDSNNSIMSMLFNSLQKITFICPYCI